MKLMPASSARWMMRIESSWSVFPHAPNIIAPRQSGLTLTPLLPSLRCSMAIGGLDQVLSDNGSLGGSDLVQPAHRCRVWRVAGDLRIFRGLCEDLRDRVGEGV